MEIVEWLDAIGAGLGAHAAVIHKYGATFVADLRTLDDEDIETLAANLRDVEGAPPPLKIKWILKALREVSKPAPTATPAAAAFRTPPPPPPAQGAAGSGSAGSGPGTCEEVDIEEEEDDDDYEEEEDGEGVAPIRNTGKASASTARVRARAGKKQSATSAAAAAAGKATLPFLHGRSSSTSNWHGLGGQASAARVAAGRARPFGGLAARVKGHYCVNPCGQVDGLCRCPPEAAYSCTGDQKCASRLAQLTEGALAAAARTPSEVAMRGGTATKYNYARLKLYLLHHAFTSQGNILMHLSCLQSKLNISSWFTTALHRAAITLANAKTQVRARREAARQARPCVRDGARACDGARVAARVTARV